MTRQQIITLVVVAMCGLAAGYRAASPGPIPLWQMLGGGKVLATGSPVTLRLDA